MDTCKKQYSVNIRAYSHFNKMYKKLKGILSLKFLDLLFKKDVYFHGHDGLGVRPRQSKHEIKLFPCI